VVGEPGVGKSRLFAHSHRTQGCLVMEAASVSYGKATTYFPVIELLRGYFQIELHDDTRKIQEKVTGKLLSLDRAWEPSLLALFALLDVLVARTLGRSDPWFSHTKTNRLSRFLNVGAHRRDAPSSAHGRACSQRCGRKAEGRILPGCTCAGPGQTLSTCGRLTYLHTMAEISDSSRW
jgi:hypothetical protein